MRGEAGCEIWAEFSCRACGCCGRGETKEGESGGYGAASAVCVFRGARSRRPFRQGSGGAHGGRPGRNGAGAYFAGNGTGGGGGESSCGGGRCVGLAGRAKGAGWGFTPRGETKLALGC